MKPDFIENFEYNGAIYKIEYFGISYRCEALNIFGERDLLAIRRSIKRKINKARGKK